MCLQRSGLSVVPPGVVNLTDSALPCLGDRSPSELAGAGRSPGDLVFVLVLQVRQSYPQNPLGSPPCKE